MTMTPEQFTTKLIQLKTDFSPMQALMDAWMLLDIKQTNMDSDAEVRELMETWEVYESFYNKYLDLVQQTFSTSNLAPRQDRELHDYCNEVMDKSAALRKLIDPFAMRMLTISGILDTNSAAEKAYSFFQTADNDATNLLIDYDKPCLSY